MDSKRMTLLAVALLAGVASAAVDQATAKIDAKLLALHRDEAKRWEIFVDAARTKKAVFGSEPIYRWTNASRANGQIGAMFVWTFGGVPWRWAGSFRIPRVTVA